MMKAANKSFVGRNYPNADHGFLRAQTDPKTPRDTANEQASALSYDITDADREVSRLRSRFTPVYGNW